VKAIATVVRWTISGLFQQTPRKAKTLVLLGSDEGGVERDCALVMAIVLLVKGRTRVGLFVSDEEPLAQSRVPLLELTSTIGVVAKEKVVDWVQLAACFSLAIG
jgi:hypothetical protein